MILLNLSYTTRLSWAQLPSTYDYFPLAVGHQWVYWVLQDDPYFTRMVESDTLLGDTLRVYKVSEYDEMYYYHYNEDSTILYSTKELPQTVESGLAILNTQNGLRSRWIVTYGGFTRAFAIMDTGKVYDLFGQTWPDAQLAEVDAFSDTLTFLEAVGRYVVGIGPIQYAEDGIVYARINGIEYGENPTSVGDTKSNDDSKIPKTIQLHVYPNPVNQTATFLLDTDSSQELEISIVNILGERVRIFTIKPTLSSFQLPWDGKDKNGHSLASGAYFAIARSGNISKAIKFTYLLK